MAVKSAVHGDIDTDRSMGVATAKAAKNREQQSQQGDKGLLMMGSHIAPSLIRNYSRLCGSLSCFSSKPVYRNLAPSAYLSLKNSLLRFVSFHLRPAGGHVHLLIHRRTLQRGRRPPHPPRWESPKQRRHSLGRLLSSAVLYHKFLIKLISSRSGVHEPGQPYAGEPEAPEATPSGYGRRVKRQRRNAPTTSGLA